VLRSVIGFGCLTFGFYRVSLVFAFIVKRFSRFCAASLTKKGECKLVKQCSYPLTGLGCVSRLYTDMAVIDITPQGALVVECCPGLSFDALQALTPVRLLQPELATA
ncbi:hypothetical protein WDV93_05565, partial [Pantoea ananatis]